jgi:hypothetical protein
MQAQMVGHVERAGQRLEAPTVRGHWNAELVAHMPDGRAWTLFIVRPPPQHPNRRAGGMRHTSSCLPPRRIYFHAAHMKLPSIRRLAVWLTYWNERLSCKQKLAKKP